MSDIHQTIKAGADSICPGCAHYFVCRAVDNQPCNECNQYATAVRHGRWIDNGIQGSMLSGCSVCGFTCGAYTFKYCPNCGARMDGAE